MLPNGDNAATGQDEKPRVKWAQRIIGIDMEKRGSATAPTLLKQSSLTPSINTEQSIRSTHSGQSAIVKQRLIRMLIVIVVIFFCCWTPSYIWWLLLTAQDTFGVI
jgi:hypothetical protein